MSDEVHPLIQKYGVAECRRRCYGMGYNDVEAFLFTCNFLYITHKQDKRLVCLADVITSLQLEAIQAWSEHRWVYILKSRKEGISTIYAAWNFRHIWLIENFESLLLSLDNPSAAYLKSIYQFFHDHVPPELQGTTVKENKYEIKYDTGGWLRSMTASTDAARGSTPRSIHASEFAQYTNIRRILEAALQAGTDDCEVVHESTAKGMNEAYDMWVNPDNGIEKVFITWINSPNCRQDTCKGRPPQELLDAQKKYKFSDQHLNWATDRYHQRCGSNWDSFCQEYPMCPEDAFIASGARYFTGIVFPDARFDEKKDQGYREYEPPEQWSRYVAGVDSASGSPTGDFSTLAILNIDNPLAPRLAAAYYQRIAVPYFAKDLMKWLSRYHDPLAVVEINGPGSDVLWRLREAGYTNFFRRRVVDKVENIIMEKLGWHTSDTQGGGGTRSILFSKLLAHARGGMWAGQQIAKFDFRDERLQFEVNSVIYTDSGKVEHSPGKHDDLVIATGLALQGIDQAWEEERHPGARYRPETIREVLEFEAQTGLIFKDLSPSFFDSYEPRKEDEEEVFPIPSGLNY